MSLRLHLAYKSIKRLRSIVFVFVKYGFQPFVERLHLTGLLTLTQRLMLGHPAPGLTDALRLRLALEELGPTFIKVGQVLSTRPDVLPEDFIIELLKLQDEVLPIPYAGMVKVIEDEFKRPVSGLFERIDERPIAAASIAQVHRAVLSTGAVVAVKVQRPDIEGVIETDISILRYLARIIHRRMPESRLYDPMGMVEEFSRVIKRELDFTLEASYMEKFKDALKDDARVKIPKVYWEMTGKRVLTMEGVTGIKVDNVERLRAEGINTRKVAHMIADVFFKQVFDLGLFHGDLHSGNIFVISEDKFALVDFGIVGRIDKRMKRRLADILIGFATGDFESLAKVYTEMGILPENIDRPAFEQEYYDTMQNYFGRPLKHVRMGELMLDYIRLASRYGIRLPKELMLFDKCLIELEGLAKVLYPDVNILSESEPYARRLITERISPAAIGSEAAQTLSAYAGVAREMPSNLNRVIKKAAEDRFRIEFMHRGLEDFMGEVDRSSNRLTFAVIMAALVIGSSLVVSSGKGPVVMGYPLLGIAGFVIASILGLWLAVQILRSGKF
ncbi:MAG: ubiquinone biosynthesis protein UbiB [Deltaproteobacteria bacterium]|nr:ubiquinone biosynthesis protein UbiB [Deltaproteobacteria bacterium]